MKSQKLNFRFGMITIIVLIAAMTRLIPHPANFSPVGAMALFGSAYYSKRYLAFLIPVTSMWISDLFLNNVVYSAFFNQFVWFYPGSIFTYISFILIALMGMSLLKKISIRNLFVSALLASVIFFIVSNFGVWFSSGMYPRNLEGLISCYIAGIPFFKNTIFGNLFYTVTMFGLFELFAKKFNWLRISTASCINE